MRKKLQRYGLWSALFDIQYIYVGKTSRNRRARKIGISRNVEIRWRAIDRSEKRSREEFVFCQLTPFATAQEQFWLNLTKLFRYRKMRGSGRSEWRALPFFFRPLLIPAVLLLAYIAWIFFAIMAFAAFSAIVLGIIYLTQ